MGVNELFQGWPCTQEEKKKLPGLLVTVDTIKGFLRLSRFEAAHISLVTVGLHIHVGRRLLNCLRVHTIFFFFGFL